MAKNEDRVYGKIMNGDKVAGRIIHTDKVIVNGVDITDPPDGFDRNDWNTLDAKTRLWLLDFARRNP